MHKKDVRVKIQENMMRELSLAQVDLTMTLTDARDNGDNDGDEVCLPLVLFLRVLFM